MLLIQAVILHDSLYNVSNKVSFSVNNSQDNSVSTLNSKMVPYRGVFESFGALDASLSGLLTLAVTVPQCLFSWVLTFFSFQNCRLILHIHQQPLQKHPNQPCVSRPCRRTITSKLDNIAKPWIRLSDSLLCPMSTFLQMSLFAISVHDNYSIIDVRERL